MSGVQVSIVTHESAATIEACLESVMTARTDLGEVDLAIDVIDNASADATVEIVESRFPGVRVHRSATNVGFGTAHNRVLGVTRHPQVLLLNPDARLQPGALVRLVAALDDDPRLALVGPRLEAPDGKPEVSYGPFPGARADLRQRRRTRAMDRNDPEARDEVERELGRSFRPDWISGACVLGRTSLLREVGLFDPRFFLYLEDVDLCLRLHQAGYEVAVEPRAICVHRRGASLPDRDAARRHFRASRTVFEEKHGTRLTAFLYRHFRA